MTTTPTPVVTTPAAAATPTTATGPGTTTSAAGRPTRRIAVDRTECRGRGVCATLLPEDVTLDEWGYPVFHAHDVDAADGERAIRMCPARALSWARALERRGD